MLGLDRVRRHMKNIQIIDGADNCVYDVFAATETEFRLIFKSNTNIAFINEVYMNGDKLKLDKAFEKIWKRRLNKQEINGIHGTIFYELDFKKAFYPARLDEEAVNPDGSALR
jgi:hypothetical protein